MKEWFRERYEDPANSVSYITAEGGYQWEASGRGPHDALEVLQHQFEGEASEETINELAKELTEECFNWANVPDGANW